MAKCLYKIAGFVLLLWSVPSWGLNTISLGELEQKIYAAPQVNIAKAQVEYQQYLLARKKYQSGLVLFGNLQYGAADEPVTNTTNRKYTFVGEQGGLEYPLLGTRAKQKDAILQAKEATDLAIIDANAARQFVLLSLQKAYIDYWIANQVSVYTKNFLAQSQLRQAAIVQRAHARISRHSSYLLTVSQTEVAEREKLMTQFMAEKALGNLRITTGENLTNFSPATPVLKVCAKPAWLYEENEKTNPDYLKILAKIDNYEQRIKLTQFYNIDSNIQLGQSDQKQYPSIDVGTSVYVSLNFRLPAHVPEQGSSEQSLLLLKLSELDQELILQRMLLRLQADTLLQQYYAKNKALVAAASKYQAQQKKYEEAKTRYAHSTLETVETLQQANFDAYQAALEMLQAKQAALAAAAELSQLSQRKC